MCINWKIHIYTLSIIIRVNVISLNKLLNSIPCLVKIIT